MTTIRDIREHFFAIADWVDPDETCDRIIHGDPDREIRRIGTGWVPCVQNLEAAAADGCDLFISHETCFYGHWAPGLDSADTPWGRRRLAVLERTGMACMNQHDTWDNFPRCGVRDAWRDFLGLGAMIAERPYYDAPSARYTVRPSLALCRTSPTTLREFAAGVARRCSVFPCSQGVTVQGAPDAAVTTVAIGVGCHIPTLEMFELGADALVVTFDRALQTTIRIPLLEMGANLVVVEHGVAEMPAMRRMAEYLESTFPEVSARFYCHEPGAFTVGG